MVYTLDTHPVGGHFPDVDWGTDRFPKTPALDPINDGGVGWKGRNGGVPVDGANFPKSVIWKEPKTNPPPDFDGMPTLNVSGKAKSLIESLEPNVHQFFQVEYVDKLGEHLQDRFWLVICNRVDAGDREASNMILHPGGWWLPPKDAADFDLSVPSNVNVDDPPLWVVNGAAVEGKHLWVDKHSTGPASYMSGQLHHAFLNAGITGLRPEKVEVI